MLVDFGSFPLLAPVPNPQAASLCLPLARPQRSQIVIVRSLYLIHMGHPVEEGCDWGWAIEMAGGFWCNEHFGERSRQG